MKKLLIIAIVALALIPELALASHFKRENLRVAWSPAGTYYKGYAWIFQVDIYTGYIYYASYQLEDDGSIKKGSDYGTGFGTDVQPACCVFQDKIYLFWYWRYLGRIFYATFDGSHWTERKALASKDKDSKTYGMAAAVMGDRLYFFYQGNDCIMYQYTSDGKNWSEGKYVGYQPIYQTGGNIAAATYFVSWERHQRILLAWPTLSHTQIETMQCYLSGNKVSFSGSYHSIDQYAEGVAMAPGTVDGDARKGSGYNEVMQIFALGKRNHYKQYPLLRTGFLGGGAGWTPWETVSFGDPGDEASESQLCAVTNYKVFGAHNLRQEIWLIYPWRVIRWDSDQYVRVQDTSQQLYDRDAYKKYWTLLGVVEGPPPYALNGRNPTSDSVELYSHIAYAVETDTAVSSSSTTEDEFFVSAGGPGSHWPGVGVSYTQGMEHKFCTRQVHSEELTHTFKPSADTARFWVYRYYLRPTMRRLKYEIRDWKGNSLGRNAYIFSISDYNLHVDVFDMRDSLPYKPRIWDPATYQDRHIRADTSHYHIKAGRMINWVIDSEVELRISEEKGLESSQSFTQTMEIEEGMEGVFDIGEKGSVSFEHEVSTDSINTVTVLAASPAPPAGYSGKYIKSFSFYPYWLEPKDSIPYWIPKEFKHQRPWCITYEVTEIEYDMASSGLAEEESLPSLKLYAISPNPSGSEVTIRYALPEETKISLKIYNVNGRLVKALANREQNSGVHSISWNGRDEIGREVANGVYFCKLSTEGSGKIRRIVLVR